MNPFVCGVAVYMKYCVMVSALALSRQPIQLMPPHVLYEMEQVMAGEVIRQGAETRHLCRLKYGWRQPLYVELLAVEVSSVLRARFLALSRADCTSRESIL